LLSVTSAPERPPEISPLVDWFSRHGIKVLAALLLVELGFHAWAVTSAKKRDAAAAAASAAVTPVAPAPVASDSLADSTAAAPADSAGTR
jgi:predicted negative regulator of RcsB-dependent stress response